MKVTYEFNTDSEDFDREELRRFEKAMNMAACIWDIEQQLRSWYKYDSRSEIPVDEIREKIFGIIEENDIRIDDLYS